MSDEHSKNIRDMRDDIMMFRFLPDERPEQMRAAADHIDALTAENAKLREACEAADEFLSVFRESVKWLDQKFYERTMQTLRTALRKEQP